LRDARFDAYGFGMGEQNADTEYRVLARKYRPTSFDDLIGQQPMVRTLSNAFATGRIAQAYMLTGVRGVGKTTTARILARALNYETDAIGQPTLDLREPGFHCPGIMEGNHVDVIEMDAASHTGINDIREIIASVRYKPVSARYKVYIIDEVHMLSTAAFNGLLKTLEEPPGHVKFIFATTEIRKVPITVLSRCQRFDLRRIDAAELTAHLNKVAGLEGVDADAEALSAIARAGEGSARDALSLLDQAIAHSSASAEGKINADDVRTMLGLADRARVIDLFEHVMKGEIAAALTELKDQYDRGANPVTILTDLAEFVHFVTRVRYVDTALDDPSLTQEEKKRGKEFAQKLSPRILGRTWQMLLKGIAETQSSSRPLAAADMVLVRITHAADLPTPDEALKKLAEQGTTSATGSGAMKAGTADPKNAAMVVDEPSTAPSPSPGNGPTMMQVVNGPSLVVENELAPAPQPTNEPQRVPLQAVHDSIETFQDLLNTAEKKRDIKFKLMLRNHVGLVAFEPGRIEYNPVGNPPGDLRQTLFSRLRDWTGQTWSIVESEAEGEATVKELETAAREQLVHDAAEDPVVSAVLRTFPKSRIIDVRVAGSADGLKQDDVLDAALDNPDEDVQDTDKQAGDPGAGGMDDYFLDEME